MDVSMTGWRRYYFDSCMREDCNRFGSMWSALLKSFRFMHARGLQPTGLGDPPYLYPILIHACATMVLHLSALCSRMILIHVCARIAIVKPSAACSNLGHFNSCMREDCNKPRVSGGGASFISIHACAKIATDGGGAVSVADVVLIHACAKIATGASAGLWSSFLIHACARIATARGRCYRA